MFHGSLQTRVDEKGRLKLPADVKRELDDEQKFFVTSEDGKVAQLYPLPEWERRLAQVMKMPVSHPQRVKFMKTTSHWGQPAEMDAQGRILLPQRLREKANLMAEDVSVIGVMLAEKAPGYPGILEVVNYRERNAEVEAAPITDDDRRIMAEFGA